MPELVPSSAADQEIPTGRKLLYAALSVLSVSVVISANYVGAKMFSGDPEPLYSGYFFGRCVGSFFLPAIVVLLYYKVRNKSAHNLTKLLLICTGALLPAFAGLSGAVQSREDESKAAIQHVRDMARASEKPAAVNVVQDKWDRVMVQYLSDLRAFNDQYVADVSKTDSDAPQLLSLDSFRDAATMQRELACVQARLDINAKYASLDPLLAKTKGYVSAVDASDTEKREFLENFTSEAQRLLDVRKSASDLERTSLLGSNDVYQYALAHQNEFTISRTKIAFRNKTTARTLDNKLGKARAQYAVFLRRYAEFHQYQDAALAQMGVSAADLPPTKTN